MAWDLAFHQRFKSRRYLHCYPIRECFWYLLQRITCILACLIRFMPNGVLKKQRDATDVRYPVQILWHYRFEICHFHSILRTLDFSQVHQFISDHSLIDLCYY